MCKGREGPHESVDDVLGVRVVRGIHALPPDVIHDLVLALSRHARVRDDDLQLRAEAM